MLSFCRYNSPLQMYIRGGGILLIYKGIANLLSKTNHIL